MFFRLRDDRAAPRGAPRERGGGRADFSLTAAVVFGALAIFHLVLPSLKDVLYIFLAGISAGLAQLAMTRAYATARAARVASVGYFNVVVSALYGALALGEWPPMLALAGMALVIGGGVLVALPSFRARNHA